MAILEVTDIRKILPHRYPMLLVDRIIDTDFKEYIVGIKNLTANELFFQGHFPDDPIMPGVLQLEAMAQVGGILLNKALDREGAIAYFLSIDNAKFRKVLRPGDQMRMEVRFSRVRMRMARMHGRTTVDGELACEADMMFGIQQ